MESKEGEELSLEIELKVDILYLTTSSLSLKSGFQRFVLRVRETEVKDFGEQRKFVLLQWERRKVQIQEIWQH